MIITIVTGCTGFKGDDGKAYLTVDYNFVRPYSYSDSNTEVPDNPQYGKRYTVPAGSFTYEYHNDASGLNYRYGTYEIAVNKGEEGEGGWKKGADGTDRYYILWCDPDTSIFQEVNATTSSAAMTPIIIP